MNNQLNAIFVYSLDSHKSTQVTDGMSDATSPAFDLNGKYLYFIASTDDGPSNAGIDLSSLDRGAQQRALRSGACKGRRIADSARKRRREDQGREEGRLRQGRRTTTKKDDAKKSTKPGDKDKEKKTDDKEKKDATRTKTSRSKSQSISKESATASCLCRFRRVITATSHAGKTGILYLAEGLPVRAILG